MAGTIPEVPSGRIFITGVAGFVGSALARALCEIGREVVGVDCFLCGYESNLAWVAPERHRFVLHRSSVEALPGRGLLRAGDTVVHLAALTALAANQEAPAVSYANNVAATVALLEECRLAGVAHFIFASSCCVYENFGLSTSEGVGGSDARDAASDGGAAAFGSGAEPPLLSEDLPTEPSLIYSLGKRHCEDILRAFHDNYGVQFTCFRFFNLYGPGADASRAHPGIIPYLIALCRRGEAPVLHGSGEQRRDYVFLADLVRLLVASIEHGALNTTINAASGESVSVLQIFESVQAAVGSHLEPSFREPSKLWDKAAALFAGELPFRKERVARDVLKCTRGDTSKALRLLGWRASTSFADGVRATVAATPV